MDRVKERVCITGVTGFLGSLVMKAFVRNTDYDIRGTVRELENKERIDPLKDALGIQFEEVELVVADLMIPESIDQAIENCDYVIHTASPYPDKNPPKDEIYESVIKPAVEGTRAVLDACKRHKIKRLVFTSSIEAVIDYDNYDENKVYDEEDWLNSVGKSQVVIL